MYKIIQFDFKLFVQEKHVSHKTCTFSLGKLDEKKIISKFQRLEILNQMVGRVKKYLYKFQLFVFMKFKSLTLSTCHMYMK
jgi:hypothetical protein